MRVRIAAIVLVGLLGAGCTSLRDYDAEIRAEAEGYCETYELLRGTESDPGPAVIAYHAIRVDFDAYPPRTQRAFLDVADRLDDLDRLGRATCLVARGVLPATRWDREQIEEMLLKGLTLALRAGAL